MVSIFKYFDSIYVYQEQMLLSVDDRQDMDDRDNTFFIQNFPPFGIV